MAPIFSTTSRGSVSGTRRRVATPPGTSLDAFGHGFRHPMNMTVQGIVKDQDVHGILLDRPPRFETDSPAPVTPAA